MIFARKIYKKIPEFYTIFARKVPEFYIVIARKIFFPIFLGREGGGMCPSPTPIWVDPTRVLSRVKLTLLKDVGCRLFAVVSRRTLSGGGGGAYLCRLTHERHGDRGTIQQREPRRSTTSPSTTAALRRPRPTPPPPPLRDRPPAGLDRQPRRPRVRERWA